jgi:hypothetical protein
MLEIFNSNRKTRKSNEKTVKREEKMIKKMSKLRLKCWFKEPPKTHK